VDISITWTASGTGFPRVVIALAAGLKTPGKSECTASPANGGPMSALAAWWSFRDRGCPRGVGSALKVQAQWTQARASILSGITYAPRDMNPSTALFTPDLILFL
jgi:hypothetical protein